MRQSSHTTFTQYGLLLLAVLALSLMGIYWRPLEQLSTLWPANAILLGLFLRVPALVTPIGWAVAAVGYVAADLLTGSHWLMAVSLNLVNLLSVAVAFVLCRGMSEFERYLIPPRALPRLFLAMLAAATAAGVAGGFALWKLLALPMFSSALDWAVSELLAYIILLPAVLSAPAFARWKWPRGRVEDRLWLSKRIILGAFLFASLMASVFIGGPGVVAFPVVALLACALSCGLFATSLLTLAFSLWTLLGTAFGGINLAFDISDASALLSIRLGVASIALAPIVVASVMTSRERSLVAMRQLAEYDALTGLLNRRTFNQRACEALVRLGAGQETAGMLMIDLDNFKRINDSYGHAVGDEVLSLTAQKLSQSLRSDDLCGRLGGEEFAVLIPGCSQELLEEITQRLHQAVRVAVVELSAAPQERLKLSVSIGATLSQGPSDNLEAMLIRADQAMYAAKNSGRDQTRFA